MKQSFKEIFQCIENNDKIVTYTEYMSVIEALEWKQRCGVLQESYESNYDLAYWVETVILYKNELNLQESFAEDFLAKVKTTKEKTTNKLLRIALGITERFQTAFGQIFNTLSNFTEKIGAKMNDLFALLREITVYEAFIYLKQKVKEIPILIAKLYGIYTDAYRKASNLIFGALDQTIIGKGTKVVLEKLQEILDEHPEVRLVVGPLIAYALYYIWTKMVFKGDFIYDFNWTTNWNAMFGDIDILEIFAGSEGLELLTWFGLGQLGFPSVKWLDGSLFNLFDGWGNHILAGLVTLLFFIYSKKPELFDNPILNAIQNELCKRNPPQHLPVKKVTEFAFMHKIYIKKSGPNCTLAAKEDEPQLA